jgi:type IV pilus assembly protein PilX
MSPRYSGMRRAQRGVVLFIALIVLVAMSLAGVALLRSVDTNVLIAGNLAFRQGATMAGDWGVEDARQLLTRNAKDPITLVPLTVLNADQPALQQLGGIPNPPWPNTAYWANWQSNIDLTGNTSSVADDFDWSSARSMGTDAAGNTVSYVIHRLCDIAGDPSSAGVNCIKTAGGTGTASDDGTKGVVAYGAAALPGTSTVYYRVTVRITGPRNTVSYVQAVLN